jgi:hypothetical protein
MRAEKSIEKYIPLLLGLILLIPFLILCFFNYPSSDDYIFHQQIQNDGFWATLKWSYFNWSGRFFAFLLVILLNPLSDSTFLFYQLLSFLLILVFSHAVYLFLHRFLAYIGLEHGFSRVILAIIAFFVLFMPNTAEFYYWFGSAYSYTFGFIAFFYWLALHFSNNQGRLTAVTYTFLPIIIIGTSEFSLMLFCIFLLLTSLYKLFKKSGFSTVYKITLLISFLSVFLFFLSPGNISRQGYVSAYISENTHSLSFTLHQITLKTLDLFSLNFRFSIFIIPFMVFLFGISPKFKPKPETILWTKISFPLAFLLVPLLLFPYYWSLGIEFIPLRIINICFMTFSLLFILSSYIWLQKLDIQLFKQKYILAVCATFLMLGLVLRSNLRTLYNDFSTLNLHQKEMQERFHLLQSNKGADELILKPLLYPPKTIFHADINEDANHWYNRGLAAYYEIGKISKATVQEE